MGKSLGRKIAKSILWAAASLVALTLLIPIALYIPAVQDFAKNIAIREVSKSTGMNIGIDHLRLRWPLRLSLAGVSVTEASGDTMLTAGSLDVGVRLLPLVKGRLDVNYARLDSAFYQMGTVDSIMWLRARIDHVEISPSQLKLNMENIDLSRAMVDGADIRLVMKPDTTTAPADTAASLPMLIRAADISLKRVHYSMSMLPTIDSLGCDIAYARLSGGKVDLGHRLIHARMLTVDSVNATYLTPSASWLKENSGTTASADTATATPADRQWIITADSLRLTGRRATYAQRGMHPLPGLDMNYLQASDIAIAVDSFYNRGTEITVPLRRLEATERCGLHLSASGTFAMDSTAMHASVFSIATNNSRLQIDATMGIGEIITNPNLPLHLNAKGHIGLADVILAMPSLRQTVNLLPAPARINIAADINGTPSRLFVKNLAADYPGMLRLRADGSVGSPFDTEKINGDINIDGRLTPTATLRRSLVKARLLPDIGLPNTMTVKGNIVYRPMVAKGNLSVTADDGRVALRGSWNGKNEGYDIQLKASRFPLQAFIPAAGIGDISATISANGHGYNPLSTSTEMHADINIESVTYNHMPYSDIMLKADISGGHASGMLSSGNPAANLDIDFDATVSNDSGVTWNVDGDVRHLDLLALKIMTDTCRGTIALKSEGRYMPRTGYISGLVTLDDIDWTIGTRRIMTGRTDINATLSDSIVQADLSNGDLRATFSSPCGLDSLMARANRLGKLIGRQIATRNADIDSIQRTMPRFNLMVTMGAGNVVSQYLSSSGVRFANTAITASNDSLLSLTASLNGLVASSTRIDSIDLTARQHGQYLVYSAMMNNRPGTMDNFAHVTLNGFLGHDRLTALLRQRNIKNETGFRLGFAATVADSTATLKLVPYNPVIAYRQWKVNTDNYLSYNLYNGHISTDISLGDSISSLRLYSAPSHVHTVDTHSEDLVLQLRDIRLQDWLSLSPWAPPMKGSLSADMRMSIARSKITGNGNVNLSDFYYDNQRVGTFDVDIDVATNPANGMLQADMALMVDSVKTVTVSGTLNDSTSRSPFLLDFNMIRFPLRIVNPFLPKGMAKLSGMLNGRMDISGDMARPVFNGWLNFDSTAVRVTMLGTDFRVPTTKIPVDSGIVSLRDFGITACNDNPLSINGTANLRDLTDIGLNLKLSASDMMIVNSSRARNGADTYGKAYIDLDADVNGSTSGVLRVNADAKVLSGTNVTYVMPTATSAIASASAGTSDMVRFVSFSDTTQVAEADSIGRSMALILDATLAIQEGSTISVDLNADASSKVQVQGEGAFSFSMSPVNSGRLTGRYTISKGIARYNVPMLGEKSFDLLDGSYIAFNGDMMNPLLNIKAMDYLKANVTQSGQNSRLVTFDISLGVTGSLTNMNVVFDLSTNDDITVQNELQGMSAEQRANQAMNLLLYNTYTGPGVTANANLSGNPLYSFLESKLNSWIASNVRGVDISFGIDQYDRTRDGSTSTTTSYSYQVSKSLFDDRFKIVVGGNYSTDANADENFSQNLISDISFEYMLNRSGSMYVRIFRHTGFESILEGEITQTGVGFVIKRKLDNLRDLFRFRRQRQKTAPTVDIKSSTENSQPSDEK